MRDLLALLFILATTAPGVLYLLALLSGRGTPDASGACAILWLLVVAFQFCRGIAPGVRDARRDQWRREGRCLSCGYDVRATPGRCPECGTVVEAEGRRASDGPLAGS